MSFRLCTTRRIPSCTSSRMDAICRSCLSSRSATVIPTHYHGGQESGDQPDARGSAGVLPGGYPGIGRDDGVERGRSWLIHVPLGVTVATAAQAVDQSTQALLGAFLRRLRG